MIRRAPLVVAALCLAAFSFAQSSPNVEILKREPPAGSIPYGKIVLVDDGTCPKGQVKEITGGSRSKSIPRSARCVKRPN